MATFLWSSIANNASFAFAKTDVLRFDDAAIQAGDRGFVSLAGNVVTFHTMVNGVEKVFSITVAGGGKALTATNVTFDSGAKLLMGDNTTGTANDDLANTLTGTAKNDRFFGFGGNDTMNGQGGNDSIVLGAGPGINFGNDVVHGGTGLDWIGVGAGNATSGGSTVDFDTHLVTGAGGSATFDGIENAFGTSYADTFYAYESTRIVTGLQTGPNADFARVLEGFAGNDTFHGDARNGYAELVRYISSPSAVTVNLATGVALDGFGGTDTLIDIDFVQGSMYGDSLFGGGTSTTYSGVRFASFEGLAGNDTINGNGGFGRVDYQNSPSAVTVNLATGVALDGFDSNSTMAGVQSYTDTLIGVGVVRGSAFNDTMVGNDASNQFEGLAGNDVIDGGGGGADQVIFQNATAGVVATLAAPGTLTTLDLRAVGLGIDKLTSIEALRGGDYNDSLTGNSADNQLEGRAGNDTLNGMGGIDLVRYDSSFGPVNVNLATGVALDGHDSDLAMAGIQSYSDTLIGMENVRGSKFGDTIKGNGAANVLEGGLGHDGLTGGGGTDKFQFAAAGSADSDTISDFLPGTDDILLQRSFFAALAAGPLAAGSFRHGAGVTTAADSNDYVLYDTTSGKLYYDADGNGVASNPLLIATLTGSPDSLAATDIQVI